MKRKMILVFLMTIASSFAYGMQEIKCGDTAGVYGIELDVYPTNIFFTFSADGMESSDMKRSPARVLSQNSKVTVIFGIDHDGQKYFMPIPSKFLNSNGNFSMKVEGNSDYLEGTDSKFNCYSTRK